MIEHTKHIDLSKEIIRRFDEVLCSKASKISIDEIKSYFEDLIKTKHSELQYEVLQVQSGVDDRFKNLDQDLVSLVAKVDTDIKLAVNRASSYLTNKLKTENKGYVNHDTVLDMISDKVDRIELMALLGHKSNKNDLETSWKAVDVMHNQIKNIAVTLLELISQLVDIDANVPDSENTKLSK